MNRKKTIQFFTVVIIAAIAAVILFVVKPFENGTASPDYATYVPSGEVFVVNVKDSNHLLKAMVVLVLDTDTVFDLLAEKQYAIRDCILFILRDLSVGEIKSPDIKSILRERICTELNARLEITNFIDIEITDFVMQ